jgi:glycine/D-amino acid oxidase-like deaminating enzyme
MTRRYGADCAKHYREAERDAVDLVENLLARHEIDADVHSNGETQLAHRPKDVEGLRKTAERVFRDYDIEPILLGKSDLDNEGLSGPFFGGLTIPKGFGLNPRKYLFGLSKAAAAAGAAHFQKSRALQLQRTARAIMIRTQCAQIACKNVIVATNGYSSEDLPPWLGGRYMPAQSNVLITRPLTDSELNAQGWTSGQIAYDTRNLLHYFRLMPDKRFLFGMRGGLLVDSAAEKRARARVRRDFERMFPAWRNVASPYAWSGMVCLARDKVPFVGPVPGLSGAFAGLAYHGNGVAMGSYCGKLLASIVAGDCEIAAVPSPLRTPMRNFPMGRARRILMPPLYAKRLLADL